MACDGGVKVARRVNVVNPQVGAAYVADDSAYRVANLSIIVSHHEQIWRETPYRAEVVGVG